MPTAAHIAADGHDTEYRSDVTLVPEGMGTVWMLQRVPFHRSANGELFWAGMPVEVKPTAVHAFGDEQDTP